MTGAFDRRRRELAAEKIPHGLAGACGRDELVKAEVDGSGDNGCTILHRCAHAGRELRFGIGQAG
jgi:hypothetical protein